MKKIAATATLALLLATATLAAPKPADYSGTWVLNRTTSHNLPRMYEHVSSQKMTTKQTETQLTCALEITRIDGPALQQTFVFDLGGKATQTETLVRTPNGEQKVPMTLRAEVRPDGALHVIEERSIQTPDGTKTFTTDEVWTLSTDGKTLTVHRKDDTPRGTAEFDMAFDRA
jgi:hypothetical protein